MIFEEDDLIRILRSLRIEEVCFELNGGGDSGDTTLRHVRYQGASETQVELPQFKIGLNSYGQPVDLADILEQFASDVPDIDWINNDGGSGTVTLRPLEEPEDWIENTVTYHEPDDDLEEDDFQDDEFDDDEPLAGGDHGVEP